MHDDVLKIRNALVENAFTAVPAGRPSRGGDVAVYVFDINHSSLPTPFYSVLVSISVFMTLSTVFHSKKNPDNSPLSHSYLFMKVSLSPPAN